ncbi:MAG: hypothetical protein WBO70_03655 [Erysipelotrichaceae bacterium]
MNIKMKNCLFEIDNNDFKDQMQKKELEYLISLLKKYKRIPLVTEEFDSAIIKLEDMLKKSK